MYAMIQAWYTFLLAIFTLAFASYGDSCEYRVIYTFNIAKYIHTYILTCIHCVCFSRRLLRVQGNSYTFNIAKYIHTYILTCIHAFVSHSNSCEYKVIQYLKIAKCIHTYVYSYIHTYMLQPREKDRYTWNIQTYTYKYIHTYKPHTHIYTYIYL